MRRRANPGRFRKSVATNGPDLMARSGVLRDLRDLVQRRQFATALAQVNTQVAANPAPGFKTQLLGFAADTLFIQGKFTEAAATYNQVAQLSQTQLLQWLRPALGEVRSLLKDNQVATAQERAIAAVQRALTLFQQYQTQLAQANATITAGGQAVIPAQPASPAEVANRLAKQFFSEGEIAAAKALFQQALQLSPNSCHARLGLAEIALRENNGTLAAQLSREAITMGLYRAKTLPAWNLLLAAGRKLGTDKLDTPLLNGLAQATPKVRARAVLLIAGALRGQGDARWLTIANNWLSQSGANHPKIAAELRKLKMAQSRLNVAPLADQLQAAQAVLQTPNLGPNEWLAATKETVRLQFQLNQAPQLDALITQGETRFGAGKRARFIHGLALACKKAGQNAFAIQLLQRNVTNATGPAQVHAQWALAQLQAAQGDHAGAAQSFLSYSQNTNAPQRFRLLAMLQHALELLRSGQQSQIAQSAPVLRAALAQITDSELLLDVARQLRYSQYPQSKELAADAYQRGRQVAFQRFDSAATPAAAVAIAFKFSRRAFDFTQLADIISTWTRLTQPKQLWLWSKDSNFWNWQELILRAYLTNGQLGTAQTFGNSLMSDPATPPEAIAIVGATQLTLKRQLLDFSGLYLICEQMTQVAPTHEKTAIACYWLALRASKRGHLKKSKDFAQRMLMALGKDCSIHWKTYYHAASFILIAGLDLAQVSSQCPVATEKLQSCMQQILDDLAALPGSI